MSPHPPQAVVSRPKVAGHPFQADVDVCEVGERHRLGPTWAARSDTLSRSHLVLLSRRMSFPGRVFLVAVHLVDDEPIPLLGKVAYCDYDAEGLYRVVLELVPIPASLNCQAWMASLAGPRRL